jgi:hypothetical protein
MKMNRKQRRALANRQNAQLSTGPRTKEGKAVSSQNAVSHGLVAADPVLAYEDRDAYRQLAESLRAELNPEDEHQKFLVTQIVDAQWRIARIRRLESAYFELCAELTVPEAEGPEHRIVRAMMDRKGDPLAILRRHETALEGTYHRCHKELREAQKLAKVQKKDRMEAKARWLAAEMNDYLAREMAQIDRDDQLIREQGFAQHQALAGLEPSVNNEEPSRAA